MTHEQLDRNEIAAGVGTSPPAGGKIFWARPPKTAQIVCHRNSTAERINAKAARLFKLNASLDQGVFSVFKILSAPADQKLARMLLAGGTRTDTLCSVVTLRNGMRYSLMDVEVIPLSAGYALVGSRRQQQPAPRIPRQPAHHRD